MNPWIESAIRAGVQACLLAAAVWLLVSTIRKMNSTARCWLWWLVLAEFAVGWLCVTPIQLKGPEPLTGMQRTIQATALQVAPKPAGVPQPGESTRDWTWVVFGAWALGACVSLSSGLKSTLRMARARRGALEASREIQGEARRISAELGLPAAPQVLVSNDIQSPAAYGAVRPCVLVHESFRQLPPAEREMVLTHELAHILRRDGLFGLVPELACAVFWFVPVVHLVRRAWAAERELACDALVCARPTVEIADYRRLLLKVVEGDALPLPRTALGATADFRCLRRRLTATPSTVGPVARGAGVLAVLGVSLLAIPVSFQARASGGGLLENAGFEEGGALPLKWESGQRLDQVRYIWDDAVARTGRRSISIRKKANRYFPIAQWSQTVDYDGKSPGIEFGGWVKAEKMHKAVLDVQFATDEGVASHRWVAYIGAEKDGDPPATHDWKRLGGMVKIPPGTKQIILALQDYGPGQVWLDDVSARFLDSVPKE